MLELTRKRYEKEIRESFHILKKLKVEKIKMVVEEMKEMMHMSEREKEEAIEEEVLKVNIMNKILNLESICPHIAQIRLLLQAE